MMPGEFMWRYSSSVFIYWATFLTVLPPVSVFAFAGIASIPLVAVAPIQTRRGVADRSGLYWKTHTETWLCSIALVDLLNFIQARGLGPTFKKHIICHFTIGSNTNLAREFNNNINHLEMSPIVNVNCKCGQFFLSRKWHLSWPVCLKICLSL